MNATIGKDNAPGDVFALVQQFEAADFFTISAIHYGAVFVV